MLNQIMLEVAPKKGTSSAIDDVKTDQLHQHKLFFSISPFLAPEESLLDLGSGDRVGGSKVKRGLKRLPPPIMYSIEPLP